MAEYIKREALIQHMQECKDENAFTLMATGYAYSFIEAAPSADVAEVVHGEWVYKKEKDGCFCSVCDIEALIDPNFIGRDFAMEELSDYCPHCGAKMDGENNE